MENKNIDELEIVDFDEEIKEIKEEKIEKEEPKKRSFIPLCGKIFRLTSILFILGCCIFYGSRLIKYYRIYNPKTEAGIDNLLALEIRKNSPFVYEGEGLYRLSGNYVYKGKNVNNYLEFNNFLWRIVKINSDNSIDLVLEDSINHLAYNKEAINFKESNIYEYLKENFLNILDKDLLQTSTVCLDKLDTIGNNPCTEMDIDNYIRLLSMNQYLNSIVEDSYLNTNEYIWLTDYKEDAVWHTNGVNISSSESSSMYAVKPVITLKNTVQFVNGDGTIENPYHINEKTEEYQIGDEIILEEDTWIIYEKDENNVKLVSKELLPLTYAFSSTSSNYDINEEGSLAYYLNNTYFNSLPYKEKLVKTNWNIGSYDSDYKNISSKKIEAFVGLYNVSDLKFEKELEGYTLLTPIDEENIYMAQNDGITSSSIHLNRLIRPTISIKIEDIKNNDTLGGA